MFNSSPSFPVSVSLSLCVSISLFLSVRLWLFKGTYNSSVLSWLKYLTTTLRCFVCNFSYFSVGLRSRYESCSWCSAQVLLEICRFNVLTLIRSNRNLLVSDSFKQKSSSLWFVQKEIFLSLIRSNRNILVSNSFNQKSQVNIGCIHSVMRSIHLKNDTSMSHGHE